ncbi:MAG: PKD domain-containing protein [Acidimicrobiales bacterium]
MSIRRILVPAVAAGALVISGCTPSTGSGGGTTTSIAPSGNPVAIASASPTVGDAPLTVHFDSAGSVLGAGDNVTYSWDFGDGSTTESGASAVHQYENVGTYQAKLTITTTLGSSTSPAITITANADPQPKFYVKSTGSTGANCGPKLDPCASLVQAVANAQSAGISNIRVAGGSYTGTVTVPSGMEISGGWLQDFSDFGANEITIVYGTATSPALVFNGVNNAKVTGVNAQGVARSSGDAVGVVISGGSTSVVLGDVNAPRTQVTGGTGPNATGVLITGGSNASVVNTKVNSGTPTGAGSSAYGVRVIGLSVANVTLSDITAQPGIAGTSASAGTPLRPPRVVTVATAATREFLCPARLAREAVARPTPVARAERVVTTPLRVTMVLPGPGPLAVAVARGCGAVGNCGVSATGGGRGRCRCSRNRRSGRVQRAGRVDLYAPTHGTAGTNGAPGSGGGGGGGGRAQSADGGGGAGGGAGGNGGVAGTQGGTSGGGSFGVYASGATVNLNSVIVTSSAGGAGGSGQAAGRGGNGGNGATGGAKQWGTNAGGGGGGGGGGAGGGGGGAGGGAGGPSIAVLHVGVGTLNHTGSSYTRPAIPASGGAGGAFAAPASGGIALHNGQSAATGNIGPAGANGANGQLFRIWDNGTTTS